MNLLTELLPGARQLRAPLAVGYLWLLVAWINIPRLPSGFNGSPLVHRAASDLHHMSPVLIVVGISFFAYLVGLFFEVFDEAMVKIAATVVVAFLALASVLVIPAFLVMLWPIALPVILILAALSWWRMKKEKTGVIAEVAQRLVNLFLNFIDYYYLAKDSLLRVWSSANPVRQELISERIFELLYRNPDVMKRFCDTLTPMALRIACHNAGISSGGQTMVAPSGQVLDMPKVAARLFLDKESERLLRLYLRDRLESPEICKTVAARTMDTADVRRLVDRALANADTWVRAERPNVFEACDRLRAEGEFRRGIAVPLAVALASACSLYTSSIWAIIAVTAPTLLVHFSGLKKQENAASIVVDCVNAGVADLNLNVEDVRLLHWPTQRVSINQERTRKWFRSFLLFEHRIDSGNSSSSTSSAGDDQPEVATGGRVDV
jgi:hypothetical protein